MTQEITFEDGESYEKWMGVWSQRIGDQFLEWLAPQPEKTWVDIGCGNGTFTEQIYTAYKPANIQALDPSPEQIDFALRRIESNNVSFRVGDAMSLPFDADRFDYATMALVLFFVPDPAVGVAEMVRVTKPGGSVSAYVWDLVEGGAPFESIMAQMRNLDIDSPRPLSAEISEQSRLVETWNDAGLTNVEVKRISVDRTFTNFTEFWDIALLAPPVGSALSPLDPDVGHHVRRMTQEFLGVDDTEPVTIHGFANAIKGTC